MADTDALDAMQEHLGLSYGWIYESTTIEISEVSKYTDRPIIEAPSAWRGMSISRTCPYWCRFYDSVGHRVKAPKVGGSFLIIRSGLDGDNPLAYKIVEDKKEGECNGEDQ